MFNATQLEKKWDAVLNHPDCAPITDPYKKAVTARLLENQEVALNEERSALNGYITEAGNTTAQVQNFDPVLISLVRRAMPNIIAYDVAGVQPMTMPTGLIFAMKSEYRSTKASTTTGAEALFNEPDTAFTGPVTTAAAEAMSGGYDAGTNPSGFGEMGFSIDKTSVQATTRALRACYTTEIAQDLKAVHGLDAESELANILSTEVIAEINREMLNGINWSAKAGISGSGTYDMNDADGRWWAEKFKALLMVLELEANGIAIDTRRGKGNFVICSANIASAIAASGILDITTVLASGGLSVDPTGNLLAGTINGRMKVFVDPYATTDYITVGYRGANPYDAGVFYCPYVPLTMMRAVGESDFQPRIGFKTRYGIRANPFVDGADSYAGAASDKFGAAGGNFYFRHFTVANLV